MVPGEVIICERLGVDLLLFCMKRSQWRWSGYLLRMLPTLDTWLKMDGWRQCTGFLVYLATVQREMFCVDSKSKGMTVAFWTWKCLLKSAIRWWPSLFNYFISYSFNQINVVIEFMINDGQCFHFHDIINVLVMRNFQSPINVIDLQIQEKFFPPWV